MFVSETWNDKRLTCHTRVHFSLSYRFHLGESLIHGSRQAADACYGSHSLISGPRLHVHVCGISLSVNHTP